MGRHPSPPLAIPDLRCSPMAKRTAFAGHHKPKTGCGGRPLWPKVRGALAIPMAKRGRGAPSLAITWPKRAAPYMAKGSHTPHWPPTGQRDGGKSKPTPPEWLRHLPDRFPHTPHTEILWGKNNRLSASDLRAIFPTPPTTPNFFREVKKNRKGGGRGGEKKKTYQGRSGEMWGVWGKWFITLWERADYTPPTKRGVWGEWGMCGGAYMAKGPPAAPYGQKRKGRLP
jgi:hypothetical protein